MRIASAARIVLLSLVWSCLFSCGGGGGGSSPAPTPTPPAPTSLGLFEATLEGSAELSVIDANARAQAFVELRSDGLLSFAVTGQSSWVSLVTMLHIHSGTAGVNGPIVVDLLSGGATFNVPSRTIDDVFTITPTLAAQIAANPQNFYFNVHTGAAPIGLARGQIAAYVPREFHAFLSASEETPPNVSNARGAASVRVTAARNAEWVAALASPAVNTITLGHIHVGGPGVAGTILVDFNAGTAPEDIAAGTLAGTVSAVPLSSLSRVAFDPAGFYVNLHTSGFPNGICRGQLLTDTAELWAPLRGDAETVVVDANARGGTSLLLESTTAGRAILAVPVAQGIANVQLAHVHAGVAGVNGPILVDLMAGADFGIGTTTGSAEGSIAYDQMLYTRMLGDPGRFYSNFHTALAANGLVRGQLTRTPQTFVATLTGVEVVPPATAGNSGRAHVIVTGVHACQFSIEMTQPPAADVTEAHVHDGTLGNNGVLLIDLLEGTSSVSGDTLSGTTVFTGRTFSRMLANASAFHLDVHTAAESGGAARGQLLLLTEDTPPAGLVYDSPVTYTTGVAIPSNVPDSIGGAITSYSVLPALPAGLALHPTTGIISGTPTTPAAAADFVVTASNSQNQSTTATINITVAEGPPLTLAYTTPVVYVVGTAITPNTPTFTGGTPTLYVVNTPLPSGLALDASTGAISGTPDTATSAADYVITASNGAVGTAQATVNVRVDATLAAPSNLTYTDMDPEYDTGYAITENTPSSDGGPVASYGISPTLPAGLSFDTTTGHITGTPTSVSAESSYTVTATNATGSAQATLTIEVRLGIPKNLVYDYATGIGYVSTGTFTTMTPSAGGGAPTSWAITGTLPAGLNFNTSTGVISGTPTAVASTTHSVTASNASGTSSPGVSVAIVVYP